MTGQVITVRFSPEIIRRIGRADTQGWTDVIRSWHHGGDRNLNFGRNVPNSGGSENTWAWHVHMAPDSNTAKEQEMQRWDEKERPYDRTSNRLLVYSMDQENPIKYGILLLSFLVPNGHELLTKGPNASQRREDWENIAYTHQMTGNVPPGTV